MMCTYEILQLPWCFACECNNFGVLVHTLSGGCGASVWKAVVQEWVCSQVVVSGVYECSCPLVHEVCSKGLV